MAIPEKCPLCYAGREVQTVVTPHVYGVHQHGHAFFHCEICDVHYQYPGLNPEEEAQFYSAEFESFMSSRAGNKGGWHKAEDHIIANELTRQRRMKYILPNISGYKNLLEIGCSSGFMLFPLTEAGYNCTGIEPSGVFSEFVKSRGMVIYESLKHMLQLDPKVKFDAILHFFVLEHIVDPKVFLEAQLALLNNGGKIIFEIPNVADALYSVYDIPAFERFYWSVAHPWYFSELSLRYLLDKLGQPYEILLDQRYDLSNHMIWARDGKPGGMGRFTKSIGSELEEFYKQTLIKNGHCDTIIAVITKNK